MINKDEKFLNIILRKTKWI